jgi:hypothetical protein
MRLGSRDAARSSSVRTSSSACRAIGVRPCEISPPRRGSPCQALLAAVLEHRDQVDIPWFEAKWEETGSFSDAVLELVSRSLCSPEVIQLFTTLSAEATDPAHPAHKYFQERYRRSRELFSDALRRAAERGEIRSGASGPLLIAILDGLQIQWLIEPDFDFLGELKAYLDDLAPPSKLQSKRRSGR